MSHLSKIVLAAVIGLSFTPVSKVAAQVSTQDLYQEISSATYYHDWYQGRLMANGKRFNQGALTAAHSYIPLGSRVRVVNLKNNKSVWVTITDRCPTPHVIDLTKKAFSLIGELRTGRLKVRVEYKP